MNEAGETLAQQQAAVQSADRAAAEAQSQLDALDGHMRQVARAASTASGNGMAELDLLMTSGSAEEFVSRLVTLDVIARRTDEVLGEVAESAAAAQQARTEAAAARAAAQRTLDDVTARQARLEADITECEVQYDALSAPQQQEVVAAHARQSMAAAPAAAAGGAAQTAVDTALARSVTPTCGAPVFYYSPVSHVSMYTGNGQVVHASTSGQPVEVVSVDSMGGITAIRRIAG